MKLKKTLIHARNWVVKTAKNVSSEVQRDVTLIAFGFVATIANAQTGTAGVAGITTATSDIAKYGPVVQKLMYAIAAVIAMVGAFSIYFKMQNGDQDVKNILVLQNWLERIRKEVTNKVLSIKRISDFFDFSDSCSTDS